MKISIRRFLDYFSLILLVGMITTISLLIIHVFG